MIASTNRSRPNVSRSYICRPCNSKRHRDFYKTAKGKESIVKSNNKYVKSNPLRRKAWTSVAYMLGLGLLKKKPCKRCGSEKVHAHHPNPKQRLRVIWLCPFHHRQLHLKRKPKV